MADRAQPQRTYTAEILLRLTPEQRASVTSAAASLGKKVQDFLRDAVMRHVDSVRAQGEETEDRRARKAEEAFVPRNRVRPRGFVFKGRAERAVEREVPPPVPAPTVVVNTGGYSSVTPTDEVAAFLAKYVGGGDGGAFDRERRHARVAEIIREVLPDQREAEILAAGLDERLGDGHLQNPPEEKRSLLSSLGRLTGLGR